MDAASAAGPGSNLQDTDAQVLGMILGCVLCLAGVAVGASWVVGRIGGAERLPLAMRLVARDAARQRFRSAVAIASLVVVLAVPVMVTAVALTEEARPNRDFIASLPDEVIVSAPSGPEGLTDEARASFAAEVERVRSTVPIVAEGRLQALVVRFEDPVQGTLVLDLYANPADWNGFSGQLALGDDAAVEALRLPESARTALRDGKVVAIGEGRADDVALVYPASLEAALGGGDWSEITLDAVEVVARPFTHAVPSYLVPQVVADELGFTTGRIQQVLVAEQPLTRDQRRALDTGRADGAPTGELQSYDTAAQNARAYAEFDRTPDRSDSATTVQAIALPASAVLVFIIGACLVAIAATESDHDIATMIRVGAAPSTRRRFLALQSGYHAVLGALLGTPVALLLLVSLRRALSDPGTLVVPWLAIGVVLVAIPAALTALVALFVRSTPPQAVLRR